MKKTTIFITIAALLGFFVGFLIFGVFMRTSADHHDHSIYNKDMVWTCPMHPQIKKKEFGSCPLCGMDLASVVQEEKGLSSQQFRMTENAMALANIRTTKISAMAHKNSVTLSGKIAVNDKKVAAQTSYFDGRIESLHVNYVGQEIKRGQLLATIYSPELIAAQQELLTVAAVKIAQPQLYKAVRNKMKLWKLSSNQIDAIEESGKIKENFPIYTTVSGTVSEVLIAQGDHIKKGQPIARVNNLNTVWAVFDVYERDLEKFEKGQHISIATNANPNKKLDAVISFVDPVINTITRTGNIRAVLKNTEGFFKPGMFVAGKVKTIEGSNKKNLLSIPTSSILWTGEKSLVYVKVPSDQPVFEIREVILGNQNEEFVEVLSGLNPNDEVVVNGTFTVDAAAQLQGKKSMMNDIP